MTNQLKTSSAELVKHAKNRITEITAAQALDLYQDEKVVIVDIRDIRANARN